MHLAKEIFVVENSHENKWSGLYCYRYQRMMNQTQQFVFVISLYIERRTIFSPAFIEFK
jgi:hypothetical protein